MLRFFMIALAASGVALAGEPLGLDRLRELLESGIDTEVIVALVEKDCVDFDVSGENVTELSRTLPTEVLRAAIECAGSDVAAPSPAKASSTASSTPAAPGDRPAGLSQDAPPSRRSERPSNP